MTIKQLAVYEAKTRLSELLDDVQRGDEVLITRRGEPVARLVPADQGKEMLRAAADQRKQVAAVFKQLGSWRRGVTLDLPLRQAIDAGRD